MEIKAKTPWEEKFTWFWFSDEQIFEWTQEDFDKAAKELYDNGITMAINFTVTHFRFGCYRYWDKIHNAFKMFCDAAHKYGIKVIEHNSASLWHDLYCSGGWKRFEEDIDSYTHFTSGVENWIEVPRYLLNEPEAYGHKLYDMHQIDGRTGKRARMEEYNLNVFCYNNPEYRDAYFKYRTEELKIVPFDGIMDDDVQWFGDGHACTCKHCRKLFKEQYGYDLPQPEDWDEFYNDYNNPIFIAWLRFKKDSTERFYRDLTKLYESLGLKLLRPNYCSDVLKWCPTFYGFGSCMDQWTLIFQENCFSAVMKNSYPDFMVEAVHRFASAEKNGVPSMSMFYPDREDSVYFGWALSRTWGQLYTGTCEGMDTTPMEKKYRDFEAENILAYSSPKKFEDVAFYFSMKTRDFTAPQYEMAEKYTFNTLGAMQASCHALLGTGMAFENDTIEELSKHKAIMCAFSAMVDDGELSRFREYVNRGGRLIIYGDFATVDETNAKRNINETLDALGIDSTAEKFDAISNMSVNYGGKSAEISDMRSLLAFNGAEAVAAMNGKTVGIRANVGDGEIIWFAVRPEKCEFQKTIWSERRVANPPKTESQPSLRAHQLSHSGALLDIVIPERQYEIKCDNIDLLAGVYNTEAGIAINIANVKGCISEEAEMVTHSDIITSFVADAPKLPEIKISVKCDGAKSATLKTPEIKGEVKLDVAYAGGVAEFTIPADVFASYALIVIEK